MTGTSVKALSSAVDTVASYAIEGADGKMRVVLINHDTAAHSVTVSDAGAHTIALYGFDGTTRIGSKGTVTGDGNTFTVTLGARSATLAVVQNWGRRGSPYRTQGVAAFSSFERSANRSQCAMRSCLQRARRARERDQ